MPLYRAATGGSSSLEVKEADGSPDVSNVSIIQVSNGTLTDNGGGNVSITTSGGGGGSDLVQTASGAGSVRIPGMLGWPDAEPGSPSASDQEFGSLSGNTVLGSLDTNAASGSYLTIRKNSSGTQVDGDYWACPSTPFTMTAKLQDALANANFCYMGLMLTESSPGKLFTYGLLYNGGLNNMETCQWTNRTTRGSFSDVGIPVVTFPLYLRMVVTSGTDVTCSYSRGGKTWVTTHTSAGSGLTPANWGVFVTGYGSIPVESVIDWVRFT